MYLYKNIFIYMFNMFFDVNLEIGFVIEFKFFC